MTPAAASENELSLITTTSSSPALGDSAPTGTVKALSLAYSIDMAKREPSKSEKRSSFSNFVKELESEPEFADLLNEARVSIADKLDAINGNGIRRMRLEQGWSQAKLAAKIGTTQSHIARSESGRSDVQMVTLKKIAKALKVDANVVCAAFLAYCSTES